MSAVSGLVQRDGQYLLNEWESKLLVANNLMTAIGNEGDHRNSASVEALEVVATSLDAIYQEVYLKATGQKQKFCKYFSIDHVPLIASGVDVVVQLVTAAFLTKIVAEEEKSIENSLIAGLTTVAAMATSWFRGKVYKDRENRLQEEVQLMQIIANKNAIDHIKATVTIIRTTKVAIKKKQFQIPLRQMPRQIPSLQVVVQRVLDRGSERRGELRKEYVVSGVCGFYKILSRQKIEELIERYQRLKVLITELETIIKTARDKDPDKDVGIIFEQLESPIGEVRRIFQDAGELVQIYDELGRSRVKYIAANFRAALQFCVELGSLGGTIVEGIATNGGSSNTPAKIAGLSLFVINSALTFFNIRISSANKENILTLQQIKLLKAQEVFLDGLVAIIARQKLIGKESSPKEVLIHMPKRTGSSDSLPVIASPGSPLQDVISRLYRKSHPGGTDEDWRPYLARLSSPETDLSPPCRRLSVRDLCRSPVGGVVLEAGEGSQCDTDSDEEGSECGAREKKRR